MNNDAFTIRPLDFVQITETIYRAQAGNSRYFEVYLFCGVWWGDLGPQMIKITKEHPTKEAAMAACEQHWRKEIEPALVRGEPRVWVRCRDRMPDVGVYCLIWGEGMEQPWHAKLGENGFWTAFGRAWQPDEISHWMALPDPPEKEEEEDGRDALLARALEALKKLIDSAHPHPIENSGMYEAWRKAAPVIAEIAKALPAGATVEDSLTVQTLSPASDYE